MHINLTEMQLDCELELQFDEWVGDSGQVEDVCVDGARLIVCNYQTWISREEVKKIIGPDGIEKAEANRLDEIRYGVAA